MFLPHSSFLAVPKINLKSISAPLYLYIFITNENEDISLKFPHERMIGLYHIFLDLLLIKIVSV